MVKEITSKLDYVTQTKRENRQTMETKYTCFCEESFTDRWGLCAPQIPTESPNSLHSYTSQKAPW